MLETLNNIRIDDMVFEVPTKKEFVFNPDEELSGEEKDEVFSFSKKLKDVVFKQEKIDRRIFDGRSRILSYRDYFRFVGMISILLPKDRDRLSLDNKDKERMEELISQNNNFGYLDFDDIFAANNLFPGVDFSFTFPKIKDNFEHERYGMLTHVGARNLSILFPGQYYPDSEKLTKWKEEFLEKKSKGTANLFDISSARILYPHLYNASDININDCQKVIKELHAKIGEISRNPLLFYDPISLRIATSPQVEITSRGIVFNDARLSEPNRQFLPPERRKF